MIPTPVSEIPVETAVGGTRAIVEFVQLIELTERIPVMAPVVVPLR